MQIPAGRFKAICLKLMDQVQQTGEEVLITKHGKPVARLVPVDETAAQPLYGYLRDAVQIHGDIVAPLDENWEAADG
ncbi:type II toxin-antitoxin system Phd/YefM family antitoxin [Candidatus Latescibacterota bacterium]